jgi:O-acetylserine/cysteine efflux transporter
MSDKQKTIALILLGAVLGGATPTIVKIGVTSIPPLIFTFLRFLIAAIITVPFLWKTNFLKDLKYLILFSTLGTLNIVFFSLGVKMTTATVGQLLYSVVPLLTAVLLLILFKNKITGKRILGIVIGFIGVIFVALLPIIEKGGKFSGDLLGNVLVGIGVILWSLYMAYSKRKLKSFSPFIITSAFVWVTCIALFPFAIWEMGIYPNWQQSLTLSVFLSLGYVAIISTIISFFLNQYIIRLGGAVLASLQYYLIPIFTYISALILLGEGLTRGLVLGGILVLLGVYITSKNS